jgi:hypothetical protein
MSNRRCFLGQAGGLLLPSLTRRARAADEPKDALIDRVQLDRARSGYDKVHCWVHPRAGAIPGKTPSVVITMQELLLSGSSKEERRRRPPTPRTTRPATRGPPGTTG